MIEVIQPFTRGNAETVARMNELVAAVNALYNALGDNMVGEVHPLLGVTFTFKPPAVQTALRRMRITAIGNDYLTCKTWDGTTLGTDSILVARPFKLRHILANYPGLTTLTTTDAQTVQASDGTTTETWVTSPSYNVDDEINAAQPAGGTGVSVAGTALTWLDANVDARAWWKEC